MGNRNKEWEWEWERGTRMKNGAMEPIRTWNPHGNMEPIRMENRNGE